MTDRDDGDAVAPAPPPPGDLRTDEVQELRREVALLRNRVARLEREAAAMRNLVVQAKRLKFWDFTPYRVHPDESWVAVDRASAGQLLGALAGVDHWDPWHTRIEPRPQP